MAVESKPRKVVIITEDTDVLYESTLIDWLARGVSIAEMAESWGVTPQTIHYHLRRMGYVYSRTQGWRRDGAGA